MRQLMAGIVMKASLWYICCFYHTQQMRVRKKKKKVKKKWLNMVIIALPHFNSSQSMQRDRALWQCLWQNTSTIQTKLQMLWKQLLQSQQFSRECGNQWCSFIVGLVWGFLLKKSRWDFDSLRITKKYSCQLFLEELVMTIGEQYNCELIAVYSCIQLHYLLCICECQMQSAPDYFNSSE